MIRDPNNPCLFCNAKESGIAAENKFAYASYDSYPVSDFHCLIIPKRHVKDYFEMSDEELLACNDLITKIKNSIFRSKYLFIFCFKKFICVKIKCRIFIKITWSVII